MLHVSSLKRCALSCILLLALMVIVTPELIWSGDLSPLSERHSQIQLQGTTARVGAYEREGRIKRLYGEAFSSGSTPGGSADAFLRSNALRLGVDAGDLKQTSIQPIMYDRDTGQHKFYGINYSQFKGDIPVFRSRLVLLVRNTENFPLVLASVDLRNLGDFDPLAESGIVNPSSGISRAANASPDLSAFSEPELVIWAGVDEMLVEPVLAYTFIGDNDYVLGDVEPEKVLFVADAVTGELLYQENLIMFVDVEGNVLGKATQGGAADICNEEVADAMPWARVNIGTTVSYADDIGYFVIPNSGGGEVTVESRLRGLWFRVYNEAGSDALLTQNVIPPGPANFIHNGPNTDEYYRAQVNGYLQANTVREYTLTYSPAYPGLQQSEFPVNVNATGGYCPGNAWYDGVSITFCRSSGSYPNTGFSTVIYHEYGHHLVELAGSGQGAYGEGMGDVMGVLITDDPGLAYGFFGNCNVPLRNADNNMQYPCVGEIHDCGTLISGAVWSTRNELLATNPGTYRDILSNLAINAMLLHTGSDIDPSITIDYLTLDDDNGDIYDGTPHYSEIAAGFGAHNLDAPQLAFLSFDFPDGLPEVVLPEGGSTLRMIVTGVTETPEPGTGIMYFNDGFGWTSSSMTELNPNEYEATFPPAECGREVLFYFTAETTTGETQFWPMSAPDEPYSAVAAYGYNIAMADDFNTDLGWTVTNDPGLTSGAWERGVPVGGGSRGDPPTDYDGSGSCYLTDNRAGDSDIDGGRTWLISPLMDLTGAGSAKVQYALWYTNDYGNDPYNDLFYAYVSNDDGANWTLAETIGPVSSSGWNEHSFMIDDYVTPTSQVKVRFEASDLNAGSVVESAVDAFKVVTYECLPADVAIQIIPDNPPVIVPQGGSFTYTGILTNNLSEPQTIDAWIMVMLPNSDLRGPVQVYNDIHLTADQVLQVDGIQQDVPSDAPLGTYSFIAYSGFYPNYISSQSSFDVTVIAPADNSTGVE